jgi:hypothetical protein
MLYFGILSDYLGIQRYVQHVANIILAGQIPFNILVERYPNYEHITLMKYAALIYLIKHVNQTQWPENIAKDIISLFQILCNNTLLNNLPSELQYLLLAHSTRPQGYLVLIQFISFEPYTFYETIGTRYFEDASLEDMLDKYKYSVGTNPRLVDPQLIPDYIKAGFFVAGYIIPNKVIYLVCKNILLLTEIYRVIGIMSDQKQYHVKNY